MAKLLHDSGDGPPGYAGPGSARPRTAVAAPERLPAFPDAVPIGEATGAPRWRAQDGSVLEWDGADRAVQLYGVHGWHLGEFDPVNGGNLKLAEPGRRLRD